MRAIKIFFATTLPLLVLPSFAGHLTCESTSKEYRLCHLSDARDRDIRIVSGNDDCGRNNAWGVSNGGIWVAQGCKATFEYSAATTEYDGDPAVFIAPGFIDPYYGPGFYYGAGYYEYNNWNGSNYCNHHNCNNTQQNYYPNNNAEYHAGHQGSYEDYMMGDEDRGHVGENYHGGFHGGGGGRR